MKKGTKSLLFGVHQFLWHPFTVWMAWVYLYRSLPTWRECVCIFIHDWGYWGKAHMDDAEGERHPEFGASIADKLFGDEYADLCLLHSRHYSRTVGKNPSRLCWADKLSIIFEPWFLYLPRAWLSGELHEYRLTAHKAGLCNCSASHRQWYRWIQDRLSKLGRSRRGCAVEYVNPERG